MLQETYTRMRDSPRSKGEQILPMLKLEGQGKLVKPFREKWWFHVGGGFRGLLKGRRWKGH